MTSVIRCEGLTKRYRGVTALDGLDLSVGPGQVFGFLGPNGAGKTTTLRILLGLVTATAGRAWVNGRPAGDPDGLAQIGAMIEEPAFYPWLTGRRNLEVLALSGPPLPGLPGQIGRVLTAAGLGAAADRKVKGYSQGMRQRLGLAAALMREPSLLLLDEPANGMDPAGGNAVRPGRVADRGRLTGMGRKRRRTRTVRRARTGTQPLIARKAQPAHGALARASAVGWRGLLGTAGATRATCSSPSPGPWWSARWGSPSR
jgi:ABC-type branched-subunit amino acid transport system ATPase component